MAVGKPKFGQRVLTAYLYGGGLPVRASILEISEAWSIPPWELVGGDKTEWMLYYFKFKSNRDKAANIKTNRATALRNSRWQGN